MTVPRNQTCAAASGEVDLSSMVMGVKVPSAALSHSKHPLLVPEQLLRCQRCHNNTKPYRIAESPKGKRTKGSV